MTQISIQLDDAIFKALETTAAKNNTSVSAWIKERIFQELKTQWPENYFSLFGMLEEDDLVEPVEIPFQQDARREKL